MNANPRHEVQPRSTHAALLAIIAMVGTLACPPCAVAQAAQAVAAPAPLTWTFPPPTAAGDAWTAERGTIAVADGALRLQPDANRRVVLLSPPGLPDSARQAESFVLGLTGTGLQRVRIQARRDVRGGWITIADATGSALHDTADGYTIKRMPGARDAPIERLRIELQFRTTNPRTLRHIDAIPASR